jgi:prepilin-type N-terminal cleavage/methylation domain-containing protein
MPLRAQSVRLAVQAFSLIELIIVAVIIAMLASMAIPRFGNSIARQRADAAAKRISADLEFARRIAMTTSKSQTVSFDTTELSYRLVGLPHLDHPDQEYKNNLFEEPYSATGISTDLGGDAEVVFDMYGTPDSGGSVQVQVGEHYRTVTLDEVTGQPTISQ